jgi:hypothetical protein
MTGHRPILPTETASMIELRKALPTDLPEILGLLGADAPHWFSDFRPTGRWFADACSRTQWWAIDYGGGPAVATCFWRNRRSHDGGDNIRDAVQTLRQSSPVSRSAFYAEDAPAFYAMLWQYAVWCHTVAQRTALHIVDARGAAWIDALDVGASFKPFALDEHRAGKWLASAAPGELSRKLLPIVDKAGA